MAESDSEEIDERFTELIRTEYPGAPAVRGRVLTGAVLLGFGVLMGLLGLFGVNWPNVVGRLSVTSAVAGLAVLLFSVPPRRAGIGDGSQV